MPSDLYRQFLTEAYAEGRAKADGFSSDILLALVGEERQSAEDLLIELARKGDTTAISALKVYDSERIRATLKDILSAEPCPSRTHCEAAWILWELTGAPEFQAALVKNLDDPVLIFQLVAIHRVLETGSSPAAITPLVRILKENRDKVCCTSAARTLLHFTGRWPDLNARPADLDDVLRDIWLGLWQDDPAKRQPVIAKVLRLLGAS